jgi:hypothetical protein
MNFGAYHEFYMGASPKTVTAPELAGLAQDAFNEKGWTNLRAMAQETVKGLRGWRCCALSRTGKEIRIRYPRVEIYLNSKLGRLAVSTLANKEDTDVLKKRLGPENFSRFSTEFHQMLRGVETTIHILSTVTCQATGLLGAKRIAEHGGALRTLHPSVAHKLQVKKKPVWLTAQT